MNKHFHLAGFLGIAAVLFLTPVYAQDDEPTPSSTTDSDEATTDEPEIRAGQEVEINEDNYRQFMELKDPTLQREIIPENAFKPGSGLQKLDNLPEESQKHLRNQLREIIVQGDPWQPGDEETEYPYTPSEAAGNNPALEKEEMEAWGELVDSYHDRESQIYENSSGSQAARGSEQGSSNSQQSGQGSPGGGQESEGSEGQQAGQEGNQNQSETEGTYSVNGSGNPDAKSTAGVSQNAMEFLQGLGKGSGSTGEGNQGDSNEGDGPGGESPTPNEAQAQAQAGQENSAGSSQQQPPGGTTDNESTSGTSQSAMEYLQGLGEGGGESGEGMAETGSDSDGQGNNPSPSNGQSPTQSEQQDLAGLSSMTSDGQPASSGQASSGESTEGTSQNAMEFLKSMSGEGGEGDSQNQSDGGSPTSNGNQTGSSDSSQDAAQAGGQQDEQQDGQDQGQASSQASGQEVGKETGQGEAQGEEQQKDGQSKDSQPTETPKTPDTSLPSPSPQTNTLDETEEESTAGAAQNALEYLTGENTPPGDNDGYKEEADQANGTLTIQDLLNAQGVGGGATSATDDKQKDDTNPDKDGDN